MKDQNMNWALFVPIDSRVPRMMIAMSECPHGFAHNSHHYTHSLFIAKINEWTNDNTLPNGSLIKYLGLVGDIEAETEMILTEHDIECDEFPKETLIGLPDLDRDKRWAIPEEELLSRRDFRKECVITIDPSSARDLDDALSIKQINEDLFEVGVHIADVTYFLKENTLLDEIGRKRTTSVYLVQKVIPMLPRVLSELLCSLNPGEDKLTFSVVWIIDSNGEIIKEWFGRTVINSAIKLSYEWAQDMIDNPIKEWKLNELPSIYGNWTYSQISWSVNALNKIAVNLRKERFNKGALRIDKLQLHFILDKESGLPSGFSSYIYRDSNKLIEEFMLLANMAVAHQIYNSFSDKAFLRCHASPSETALKEFTNFCKNNNFEVDTTTSLSLQQSLDAIVGNDSSISKVVAHFLLRSMHMANYICAGVLNSYQSFYHYALNVPLYTHFTSPIRRYADIVVHRLLAASLKYRPLIGDSPKDLHRLATSCNIKKMNSRLVSDLSAKIFLHQYIKQIEKMEEKAVVVQVYDHSFDIMLLNCGVVVRLYLDALPLHSFKFEVKNKINKLILNWDRKSVPRGLWMANDKLIQTITACVIVNVQVTVNFDDSVNKLNAILQHPCGAYLKKRNSRINYSRNVETWKF